MSSRSRAKLSADVPRKGGGRFVDIINVVGKHLLGSVNETMEALGDFGTVMCGHRIWIAVPILWAMMVTSASAEACGRLCDLEWMSAAGIAEVKAEIEAGVDPLALEEHLDNLLHLAAQANPDPSVVALFVDLGADLEAPHSSSFFYGGTPLHVAAGGWGIVSAKLTVLASVLLQKHGWKQGSRKFFEEKEELERMLKVIGNRPEVVEVLLDSGAEVLVRDNRGASPLHRAAAASIYVEVLELLLDRGAKLEEKDDNGLTPLHWAALCNTTPEVVQRLLDHGADVDAHSTMGTPLHLAALNLRLEVSSALLESGASVDTRNDGEETPLHRAARNRVPDVARVLLDHGADLESKDERGRTPLHVSLDAYNPAVSILLIERGANARVRDGKGRRPRDIMESKSRLYEQYRRSEELYQQLSRLLP